MMLDTLAGSALKKVITIVSVVITTLGYLKYQPNYWKRPTILLNYLSGYNMDSLSWVGSDIICSLDYYNILIENNKVLDNKENGGD